MRGLNLLRDFQPLAPDYRPRRRTWRQRLRRIDQGLALAIGLLTIGMVVLGYALALMFRLVAGW